MILRGLWGSLLVLVGGTTIATLPPTTPLLRQGTVVAIRGSAAGHVVGALAVIAGLSILGWAWWCLCRACAQNSDDQAAVRLVRWAAAAWAAPLLVAPPLFSRDGWAYAAQGALSSRGLSPYGHGTGMLVGPIVGATDPLWMWTPTPYGPLPVWYGGVVASHTWDPWLLVIAHRGLALVGLALLSWAVPALARRSGTRPGLATGLVVASPFMIGTGVAGLHNDLLMAGLMAAALVVAIDRGWLAGAAVAGMAAGVKLPGGLVCVGIALATLAVDATLGSRLRRLAGVGVVTLGTLVGLGVLLRTGTGWVHALGVPGVVRSPLSMPTVLGGALDGAAGMAHLGLSPDALLGLTRDVCSAAALLLVAWVALRGPTGRPDRAVGQMALVVSATLALSPVVQPWYLLWALPFVAVQRFSRAGRATLIGALLLLGLIPPFDDSPLHQVYVVVSVTVTAAATMALALRRVPEVRRAGARLSLVVWPEERLQPTR